jgi:flagellar biosynthetic protein FlhB
LAEESENGDKTEDPTEKRLSDAVEKGNLPVSREAATFAAIAAMCVMATVVVPNASANLARMLAVLLDRSSGIRLDSSADIVALVRLMSVDVLWAVGPAVLLMMAAGLVAAGSQGSLAPHIERLQFDLSRISPLSGAKRLFGRAGFVEFLKSLTKLLLVVGAVLILFGKRQDLLLQVLVTDAKELPGTILHEIVELLLLLFVASSMLLVADLFYSRFSWREKLRMSREDLKQEMKEMEGDPLMKSRLRSIALDRSRKRMMTQVPRATLVVANPTHFAIAMRYVREEGGAPVVVAKGQDLIALKIREIAEANDIPVFEDKALARSLYQSVKVDQVIPPAFYKAVAELIHIINASRKRGVAPAMRSK